MDTILETNEAVQSIREVQSVRQAYDGPATGQPKPEWVREVCPTCGGPVVSNMYYCGGSGYLCVWECWNSLLAEPTCNYRKAL